MTRKPPEEPKEPVTSGLSHTETFIKKIVDLLKEGLTDENYEAMLGSILELCEGNYDLNRAGAAAMKVAEKHRVGRGAFNLYSKMAGDLFKMQCESERSSSRTTIFTGFYNSAMDSYLDGGYIKEAVAVVFEHSHWLMRNALYKDEAGKQKYLDLSVKAFDEVMKRAEGELAAFIHEQQEGRRNAVDALRNVQPPAHLANVNDKTQLEAGAQTYQELIAFLKESCNTCDIAASFAKELAAVLEKDLPDLSREYAALAENLQQQHVALLKEHGIP